MEQHNESSQDHPIKDPTNQLEQIMKVHQNMQQLITITQSLKNVKMQVQKILEKCQLLINQDSVSRKQKINKKKYIKKDKIKNKEKEKEKGELKNIKNNKDFKKKKQQLLQTLKNQQLEQYQNKIKDQQQLYQELSSQKTQKLEIKLSYDNIKNTQKKEQDDQYHNN